MISSIHRDQRMRAANSDFGRGRDPGQPEERRPGFDMKGGRLGTAGAAVPDEAPSLDGFDRLSKDDLYEIAKRLRVEGRCRMSREQLLEAIREQENRN